MVHGGQGPPNFSLHGTAKNLRPAVPRAEWTSFLKRHKELTVCFASNIKSRGAEVSAGSINQYFDNLSKELQGVKALEKNVYLQNMGPSIQREYR